MEAFLTAQTLNPELQSVIVGVTPSHHQKFQQSMTLFLLERMMSSLVSMALVPPKLET